MKTMKELVDFVASEIDVSLYDTICEDIREEQAMKTETEINTTRNEMVKGTIEDFLGYVGIDDAFLKEKQEESQEDLDIPNSQNANDDYFCDMASEWADNKVDTYNYTLWKKGAIFSFYAEDWLNEVGFDKDRGIIGVLQGGQYKFYSDLGSEIFAKTEEFLKS
jgi:hypothetical protein